MIKPITTYLATELSLTIGTDLFAGFRPQRAQDSCLTVLERSGSTRNFDLTDREDLPIQLVARAKDYYVARTSIRAAIDALHGQSGIDLPVLVSGEAYHVATAELLSGPLWLGKDQEERHEFSANILLRLQNQ